MEVSQDNQFWREFISLYREMPELWKKTSKAYKDRNKRSCAYEKLVDFLKTKDQDANTETVKRKLNTLRGSYRRERKRVVKSRHTGASDEERYVSSLWYYNDFEFLYDQEKAEDGSSICKSFHEKPNLVSRETYSRAAKRQKLTEEIYEPDCSPQAKKAGEPQSINDSAETYGKAWAAQFRQLSPDQQTHVKRAMDEILYQGMLGNLPQIQPKPQNSYGMECQEAIRLSPSNQHSTTWDKPSFERPVLPISAGDEIYQANSALRCNVVNTDKQPHHQVDIFQTDCNWIISHPITQY